MKLLRCFIEINGLLPYVKHVFTIIIRRRDYRRDLLASVDEEFSLCHQWYTIASDESLYS
jgi:hypothetical protein